MVVPLLVALAALAASPAPSAQDEAPPPDIVFTVPYLSGPFAVAVATDGTVIAATDPNHVVVYRRSGVAPTWLKQATLSFPAYRCVAVDVDAERLVVGQEEMGSPPPGMVRVYRRSGDEWLLEGLLMPLDVQPGDNFGVALSLDGDTLAIGADAHGMGGTAYVFTRDASGWTQRAVLMADDAAPGDRFGASVGLSGDVLVVGAPQADVGATADAGAAYVFRGTGAIWQQEAKLVEPVGQNFFGVAVATDAETVLVGAPAADTPAAESAGAAYAFALEGGVWTLRAQLAAPQGHSQDLAGWSVALDDGRALVGAPMMDTDWVGAGVALRFDRLGGEWTYVGPYASPMSGGPWKQLGWSVALGNDSLVAGAPGGTEGSLHVFGDPPWSDGPPSWVDLGYGLAGVDGVPRLWGTGTLQAGSPGELRLEHAAPGALAYASFSIFTMPMAIKGGTFVTPLTNFSILTVTSATGEWHLQWTAMPGGIPVGTPYYMQFLVADPAAPLGVSFSNGLAAIIH